MGELEDQLERFAAHRAEQIPAFSMAKVDEDERRRVTRRAPVIVAMAAGLAIALMVGGLLLFSAGRDPGSVEIPAGPPQGTVPRWVISPVPHHGNHAVPLGVSCPDATHCVAVGNLGGGPVGIETLSVGTWSVTSGPRAGALSAVSCPDATHCVAVGSVAVGSVVDGSTSSRTLIRTFSDGGWSDAPSPNPTTYDSLSAVSCADANHCVAVGQSGGNPAIDAADASKAQTLIETFADGTWSVTPSPNPTTNDSLSAVSCADANHCVAVGSFNGSPRAQTLIETLSDGTWSVTPSPNHGTLDNGLLGVSCPDANHCVAVGGWIHGTTARALIETLSDGTWSVTPSPDHSARVHVLQGVSCPDVAHCVAVGNINDILPQGRDGHGARTLIETLSGGTWSVTPAPNRGTFDNVLRGVSCPDATHCIAAGGYRATGSAARGWPLIETFPAPAPRRS